MNLGLSRKVVLVAGSSQGIGLAVAQAFLQENARVLISGRNKKRLEQARAALAAKYGPSNVAAFAGDLTRPADIKKCFAQLKKTWGGVDILIAGLGSGKPAPANYSAQEQWLGTFNENLFGNILLTEAAIPLLTKKKESSIVFIASIAAHEAISAPVPYSAAKRALLSACKSYSRKLATFGTRVNVVSPGNVFFPGGRWSELLKKDSSNIKKFIQKEVPLKRFGRPDEIASAVVFLASTKASFVTGSSLVVDGGQIRSW